MNLHERLNDLAEHLKLLDVSEIEKMADLLANLNGRLFILGVGGSAGNASHAVNDFRKILNIEAYAPTDNVSELTARANDNGIDSIFVDWLKVSHLASFDMVLVLSVGGGNLSTSKCIYDAVEYAHRKGAKIIGLVGPSGGKTGELAEACVRMPVNDERKTPYTESMQAVVWHLLVNYLAEKKL